jgi:imidazolonepropionase-like amidohydrolase
MKNRILAALLACVAVTPAHAASVITADRMLDVQTGRYVDSPAIFVDDAGRISSIGDARTVRWGANVKHVDLSGKTLVPGLIDMHAHLGPADIGGYRFLEFTDSFWPIAAVGTARDMLDAGFTTIRVVGSTKWDDVGLKQAIEAGYAVGPRIVPAGHALGATGGH